MDPGPKDHGPQSDNGDRFGWALDLSGATLAVSSPYEDLQNDTDAGVVHLFTDTPDPGGGPSSWTEAARLTPSDPDSDDNFGFSIALDGARLLVGAPSRDATAEDDGAVYAFARSDAVWSERERLTAPTPAAGEHFGTAVALDGDDAVVGAPGRDGDSRDQGAAFAFAYAAGGWTHAQTLTIPAGEEHNDAEFGAAVALDAGTLAVGAPRNPSPEGNQGLVYAFSGDDGAWAPPQTLIAHDASRGARVGAAVAVSGTTVVAGAPDDDISTGARLTHPMQGSVTAWDEFVATDDAYTTGQGVPLNVPAPGVLANDSNPSDGRSARSWPPDPRTARLRSMSTARSRTSRRRTSVAPTRSATTRSWAPHHRTWRRSRSPSARARPPARTATAPRRTRRWP